MSGLGGVQAQFGAPLAERLRATPAQPVRTETDILRDRLKTVDPGQASPAGLVKVQGDFAQTLATAERYATRGGATAPEGEAEARDAAQRLVAVSLVQPLFEQLRETNDAAPPFQQTQAEKQFGALLDAQVSLDIVRKSDWPLVNELARQMLTHSSRSSAASD
ncbi:MAG: hypothetical protein AAF235_11570 [Planctomycetota bacterium]